MSDHLAVRCPDHPTYRAIRRPRVACDSCDELWLRREEGYQDYIELPSLDRGALLTNLNP